MYKKNSSLFLVIALMASALSTNAVAGCSSSTDSEWECLEDAVNGDITSTSGMSGPYTFQGPGSMYHSMTGTISGCTLTVYVSADVSPTPNEADIQVSNATSTGPGDCAKVSFGGFPWSSTVSGSSQGDVHDAHGSSHNAFGDLGTVEIYYNTIFGTIAVCDGTLYGLEFGNDVNGIDKDDPSFFTFSGSIGTCSVNGTVTSSGYTDVNAW